MTHEFIWVQSCLVRIDEDEVLNIQKDRDMVLTKTSCNEPQQ